MTQPTAHSAGIWKKATRPQNLVLLIFAPFFFLAIAHVVFLIRAVGVPNDTTYPEAASVYSFLTTLHTGNLYADPFQPPLNIQTYGPFFYLVGAVLAKMAHGNSMRTTELARLASLFSFLGSVALLGFLCLKLEGRKMQAAIVMVLGLACAYAVPISASARPDALSIFFIVAALTVYCQANGRTQFFLWAGVLGSLSILTKQSTAPVFFALLIDTLIAMKFRNTFALIAGSIPVPAVLLSSLWLRHEPFAANFSALGHAVYSWPDAIPSAIACLRINQIAIILIFIALLGIRLDWRKEKYRPILLAALFALLSSVFALANIGGAGNYMMLPWLLAVLFVPSGLVRIEQWTRHSAAVPLAFTLLGTFLVIHQRDLLPLKLPLSLDTEGLDKLNMLSNSAYLEIHSRQPELLDPNFYDQLAIRKAFSFSPVLARIDAEQYDLILIVGEDTKAGADFVVANFRGSSHWGGDTVAEMNSHYRPLCEVPGNLALVPKDRAGAPQAAVIARIFRQPCNPTSRTLKIAPGAR